MSLREFEWVWGSLRSLREFEGIEVWVRLSSSPVLLGYLLALFLLSSDRLSSSPSLPVVQPGTSKLILLSKLEFILATYCSNSSKFNLNPKYWAIHRLFCCCVSNLIADKFISLLLNTFTNIWLNLAWSCQSLK